MKMFFKSLIWLLSILWRLTITVTAYEMNMTQYYKMPSLYNLEDYDRCLQELNDLSMYCFVRADVIPQKDNEAWQAIEEISKFYKHHYQHRHLYFGMCVQWCQLEIDKLPEEQINSLFKGILQNNTKVNIYLDLFKSEELHRQTHNRLLNQCINLKLRKYNLSAESMIEYCDTSKRTIEEDAWNLTFYGIVLLLVILATASSLFDLYLKQKRKDKLLTGRDYYKEPAKNMLCKFLVSFSLARNWYRLNQKPTGKLGKDLRFLDCFKFCAMFFVILAHTNWVLYEAAVTNPQGPERLLHTWKGTLLISGSLITVTFFVISGFLLTITWLAAIKQFEQISTRQYVLLFVVFNVVRYLRLTIPYALVILWSGVFFNNDGGPMWRHILEREQLSCRKNWWTNILYVNNHVNINQHCVLQTWYLAADTQSFVLSLVILIMAHKWPKRSKWIFGIVLAFSIVLPGVLTYMNNYEAMIIATPQVQRDSFMESRMFQESYVPTHMNFGCYFSGVLAALVYDYYANNLLKLRKNKYFQAAFFSLIPVGILWLMSGHTFLQNYPDTDMRLWNGLYASMHRSFWAIGLSVFIIGMSAKCGWIFHKFCCLPIFRILGRLTYGAFMIHLLVARSVIGTLREPIYFGTGMMFCFSVFNVAASYFVSFLLALLLELPVSSLLKLLR